MLGDEKGAACLYNAVSVSILEGYCERVPEKKKNEWTRLVD